jgi:hypothetical protein
MKIRDNPDGLSVLPGFDPFGFQPMLGRSPLMKMLFSSRDGSEIRSLRQELSRAGIQCQLKKNKIAQGAFGIPPFPELWIKRDTDILKALRKIGTRRLRAMTVIFPAPVV